MQFGLIKNQSIYYKKNENSDASRAVEEETTPFWGYFAAYRDLQIVYITFDSAKLWR